MRKFSMLLSILVLAAMVLAACGADDQNTNLPNTQVPPVTMEATETAAVTETATEDLTGTPGVPVTGETDPARVSNQLDFQVMDQDGNQIGEVDDLVLDLDNSRVAYVVVAGTSGNTVLVPWDSLHLQTGTGDNTGGQSNAFILQSDVETFNNAPAFDSATLPQWGQSAGNWDADVNSYWQSGGAGGTSNTPSADTTATSTTSTGGTGTDLSTATPATGTGLETATPGTGTGTGTMALQGVALATDVLGSTVMMGAGTGTGTGTGSDLSTATPSTGGTGTDLSTATPGTGGTDLSTATPGTGTGTGSGTGTDMNTTATVEDIITDTTTGDIMYIVLRATFDGSEQWVPVPLSMFQVDGTNQAFILNADAAMLQGAPTFENGEFPDTSTSGWNSQFDSYWQSNGAGGTGTGTVGADATATP